MAPLPEEWNKLFSKAASEYEKQSAGVTRLISQQVLPLLLPITASSVIHDNACGPGIVALDILALADKAGTPPPTIYATDFNQAMITKLQSIIDEKSLKTLTAQVMDGSDLSSFADDMFTHSITNFGIFAFPDPVAGARHILRTLKPGGIAAITVWKHPGNVFFFNEVIQSVAPGTPEWFPIKEWLEESYLLNIIEKAGFEKEKFEVRELRTVWNVDDVEYTAGLFEGPFWDPAKEKLSEEQKGECKVVVRSLLEERKGKGIEMVARVLVARK
ncbi:hypothetical protein G7Y89_g3538 [Cudoniella acicularis]|uniref:Methyltransferase domain-containing protein n=1 Tax=Cudoniella acicularis TaxID=354080 RepID=A0A8H4RT68_9HELO|nr:hypothetical protein G7Y89_g3538 [Cudoniella acicularis]